MSTEFNPFFEIEDIEGVAVVTLHVDNFTDARRDSLYRIADAIKDEPKPFHVVVDLSPNPSINSRMIALLIHLQKRVKEAGGTIRYCGIVPQVRKLLDITRTSPLFQIDHTRKDSLASLGINPQ